MRILTTALILVAFLSSCTNNTRSDIDADITKLLSQKQSPIVFEKEPAPIFVTVKKPRDVKLNQKVNISIKDPINIVAAIDFADNTLSVSPDAGVDLKKQFSVKFNNQTLEKYFDYLENVSGYDIDLNDGIVYIRSIQSKTWDLQTLSMRTSQISNSARSEIASNDAAPENVKVENNAYWQQIIQHVGAIMNSDHNFSSNPLSNTSPSKDPTAVITDNQQLGIISVIGMPLKIKQVDTWLDRLIASSNRQIHLQVQILDVTVDESVGQGINWNLLSDQSSKFRIGNNAPQVIDGAGIISIGTPVGGLIDLGKRITLDVMLELLAKQGKVKIDNQPNITVTNGDEAYISTGDEFSFVSEISATPDDNGNVITTADIERISVGVEMRVTPKILPDNRIVVSVVPVISSLQSFTTLSSGGGASGQEFQTPNIALQKLATKVIVESGKTIHLGGLIASKVANAAKGLPDGGIFDVLFRSVQKSLERREIVILITPTIVG